MPGTPLQPAVRNGICRGAALLLLLVGCTHYSWNGKAYVPDDDPSMRASQNPVVPPGLKNYTNLTEAQYAALDPHTRALLRISNAVRRQQDDEHAKIQQQIAESKANAAWHKQMADTDAARVKALQEEATSQQEAHAQLRTALGKYIRITEIPTQVVPPCSETYFRCLYFCFSQDVEGQPDTDFPVACNRACMNGQYACYKAAVATGIDHQHVAGSGCGEFSNVCVNSCPSGNKATRHKHPADTKSGCQMACRNSVLGCR